MAQGNESRNSNQEKFKTLFAYEPFRVEHEEQNEKEKKLVGVCQHNFCDSYNEENYTDHDDDDYYDYDNYNDDDDEDDDDDDKDEDDDDLNAYNEEGESNDEENNTEKQNNNNKDSKLIDNENIIVNTYKDANNLLNSLFQTSFVKQVTNLQKIKDATIDKLTNIKSSIQTNMPYSISQQDITTKLKSFSNYKLNKNLMSTLSGHTSNNSLNNSINHGYSFQNKGNLLQKDIIYQGFFFSIFKM